MQRRLAGAGLGICLALHGSVAAAQAPPALRYYAPLPPAASPGSICMEPVFMVLGQSAATAAAMAIDGKTSVQRVDYPKLRARSLADGQALEWHGTTRKEDLEQPR